MWRDIALANRGALGVALAEYRAMLDELARAIASGDGATLDRVFTQASAARRRWQQGAALPKPVDR